MNINQHPSVLDLAAAQDGSPSSESVREHLTTCLACRVRVARLRHMAVPGDPTEDAIARILEASHPGPKVLARLSVTHDQRLPQVGDIWRIGRDEALLAWVRRVLDDAVDVIPMVLDTDLADQESVILPADSSPLGMPLVLLTGVRGHVGLPAFLEWLGTANVSAQVQETIAAAREGRTPKGVEVGLPLEAEDDQRIEYRQVVADLLADLAPSRWVDDPDPADGPADEVASELTDVLSWHLALRHHGVQVLPVRPHEVLVTEGMYLYVCLRVTYLDTSVGVATVHGGTLDEALYCGSALADACLEIVRLEPDVAAVAISGLSPDWPTVVLKVEQLRTAFEPPGGTQVAPRLTGEALSAVDALAKFLDGQATAWELTEPVDSNVHELDFQRLSRLNASAAVVEITAEGRRARTPAKKLAWTSLPDDLGSRIVASMAAIVAGEPVDAVLDRLFDRETR